MPGAVAFSKALEDRSKLEHFTGLLVIPSVIVPVLDDPVPILIFPLVCREPIKISLVVEAVAFSKALDVRSKLEHLTGLLFAPSVIDPVLDAPVPILILPDVC